MKSPSTFFIVPAAIIAIAAVAGASGKQTSKGCCGGMMTMQQGSDQARKASEVAGTQKAKIVVNNGYSPAVIVVKHGKPVELTFTGGKEIGCGGTVVFPSLKMSKEVASGKSATFKFTPKQKGEIAFTCGMGMLSGKVVVE